MHKDCEEILVTNEQIVARCEELGQQISKDYAGKKPLLIGLLNGAVPFIAELIKHITIDMEMEFMDCSSYNGTETTGKVVIKKDIDRDIAGRDIIFVEDIIDTGLTLSYVMENFKGRNVNSMEICVLLDKPEGRQQLKITPKYIGFKIPKKFVIGFGLDYNELYRNLPYVGVLKESVYK